MKALRIVYFVGITLAVLWLLVSNLALRADLQYTIDSLVLTQNTIISQGKYEQNKQERIRNYDAVIYQLQTAVCGVREDIAKLRPTEDHRP